MKDYNYEVINAQNDLLLKTAHSKHKLTQRLTMKREREQLQLEMAQKLASFVTVANDHYTQVGQILDVTADTSPATSRMTGCAQTQSITPRQDVGNDHTHRWRSSVRSISWAMNLSNQHIFNDGCHDKKENSDEQITELPHTVGPVQAADGSTSTSIGGSPIEHESKDFEPESERETKAPKSKPEPEITTQLESTHFQIPKLYTSGYESGAPRTQEEAEALHQ